MALPTVRGAKTDLNDVKNKPYTQRATLNREILNEGQSGPRLN